MRRSFLVTALFLIIVAGWGQDISPTRQAQLEDLTDARQIETKDASYWQQYEHLKKHPLNLNIADANELKELISLTDLQIDNFISYRNLFGSLISIYELQAIPSWDIVTIKKILPFVTLNSSTSMVEDLRKRLKGGDRSLLVRFS